MNYVIVVDNGERVIGPFPTWAAASGKAYSLFGITFGYGNPNNWKVVAMEWVHVEK